MRSIGVPTFMAPATVVVCMHLLLSGFLGKVLVFAIPSSIPAEESLAISDLYNYNGGSDWIWSEDEESYGKIWDVDAMEMGDEDPCINFWQGILCSCTTYAKVSHADSYYYYHPYGIDSDENYTSCTIIGVNLGLANLQGSLLPSFANLRNLSYLHLQQNSLHGNPFDVLVPALDQLSIICLTGNHFTGSIPLELSSFSGLRRLILSDNEFTGTIPPDLASLSFLGLDIHINHFSGSLPNFFSTASNLIRYFDVSSNKFTGSLPYTLGNPDTWYLAISTNAFTGSIPAFAPLPELTVINLQETSLSGTFPFDFLANITHVVYAVTMGDTYLTGTIPPRIHMLRELRIFDFAKSLLSGSFPSTFGQLENLRFVYVHNTLVSGTLPSSVANLSNLIVFEGYSANLRGSIARLCRLPELKVLSLNDNAFTGSIPSSISQLRKLNQLQLYDNRLTGLIPHSLFSLELLDTLLLQNNVLTGFEAIPSSLNQSLALRIVDFSSNPLRGTLPVHIFTYAADLYAFVMVRACLSDFDLPHVCETKKLTIFSLDGANKACITSKVNTLQSDRRIPDCIMVMSQLEVLHLSGLGLVGTIPANVSSSLQDLSLSNNALTGTLPVSIQVRSWQHLDVSFNKLSGVLNAEFPVTNESDTSMQVNRFSGNVPHTFEHAATVNILDGNFFDCPLVNRNVLPSSDPDFDIYICGTGNLNVLLYTWYATGMGALLLSLVYLCIQEHTNTIMNIIKLLSKQVVFYFVWPVLDHQVNSRNQKNTITARVILVHSLHCLMVLFCRLALFATCISLPLYLALHMISSNGDIDSENASSPVTSSTSTLSLASNETVVVSNIGKTSQLMYSTHTYTYAFEVSGVYLRGSVPSILLAILWCIVLIGFGSVVQRICSEGISLCEQQRHMLANQPSNYSSSTAVAAVSAPASSVFNRHYKSKRCNQETFAVIFKNRRSVGIRYITGQIITSIFYMSIIVAANVGFVYSQTNLSPSYVIYCQIAMALLEISLSNLLIPRTLTWLGREVRFTFPQTAAAGSSNNNTPNHFNHNHNDDNSKYENTKHLLRHQRRYLRTQKQGITLWLTFVSSLIAPIIAATLFSSNCMYHALFPVPLVVTKYALPICTRFLTYIYLDKVQCLETSSQRYTANFQPSFSYSYQCSAFLVRNYVSILVYGYLLECFLQPIARWLLEYIVVSIRQSDVVKRAVATKPTPSDPKHNQNSNNNENNNNENNQVADVMVVEPFVEDEQSETVPVETRLPGKTTIHEKDNTGNIHSTITNNDSNSKSNAPSKTQKHHSNKWEQEEIVRSILQASSVSLSFGLLYPPVLVIIAVAIVIPLYALHQELRLPLLLLETANSNDHNSIDGNHNNNVNNKEDVMKDVEANNAAVPALSLAPTTINKNMNNNNNSEDADDFIRYREVSRALSVIQSQIFTIVLPIASLFVALALFDSLGDTGGWETGMLLAGLFLCLIAMFVGHKWYNTHLSQNSNNNSNNNNNSGSGDGKLVNSAVVVRRWFGSLSRVSPAVLSAGAVSAGHNDDDGDVDDKSNNNKNTHIGTTADEKRSDTNADTIVEDYYTDEIDTNNNGDRDEHPNVVRLKDEEENVDEEQSLYDLFAYFVAVFFIM